MQLFHLKPQWNPDTGEPADPVISHGSCQIMCDYCGNLMEFDDPEASSTSVGFKTIHSIEEWWHEDKLIINDKPVDLAELYEFQPDFHFCADWDGDYFCEQQLMIEWFFNCFPENCKNVQQYQDLLGKIFHNEPLWESLEEPEPVLLCRTLSLARYRAIKKVLKNGLVTPEQLGISFET